MVCPVLPCSGQFFDLQRVFRGQVVQLRTIGAEIVELPLPAEGRYDFPVPTTEGPIAFVLPA